MNSIMANRLSEMKELPKEEWNQTHEFLADWMQDIRQGMNSDSPLEQLAAARQFSSAFGDGNPEHWDRVVGHMEGFLDSFLGVEIVDDNRPAAPPQKSNNEFISQFDKAADAFKNVSEGTEFNNPLPFKLPESTDRER